MAVAEDDFQKNPLSEDNSGLDAFQVHGKNLQVLE